MTTVTLDVTAPPPALAGGVSTLRATRLAGLTVTLVPYAAEFGEPLRALRNLPENQFNLAQGGALTAEQQAAWARAYFARDNDLCWIVLSPAGEFLGATRLYDIDLIAGSAEKGGLVLHEAAARTAPLALESELMLLHVAFAWLGLRQVVTQVRPENAKMLSINQRLGFQPAGATTLRGVPYQRSVLPAAGFDPTPLLPILRHWKNRHAR